MVTDGEERAALAVVRSLGAAGYRCIVTSASGRSLAGASRHAHLEVAVPPATRSPADHVETIRGILETHPADLLLPISEASLLALLPARESLPARLPFPPLDVFRAICDKSRVLSVARDHGIRVPRQRELQPGANAGEVDLPFPLVLKPARSIYTAEDGSRGKVGVSWAYDRAGMERALAGYPSEAFPVLVQEAITGPGVGVFVLLSEGEVIARFAHRRIREKPPSGGVSVLRQSEPLDQDLFERSLGLLKALDWSGVAMVEYKRDERTGEFVLMEINGRFWGSLQLAIDAGVDFPRLLADLSLGRRPAREPSYGFVRSHWFWGDVDHMLAVLRDDRTSTRDRAQALGGLLRALGPGYRSEVLRWRDPAPFVKESLNWLRALHG